MTEGTQSSEKRARRGRRTIHVRLPTEVIAYYEGIASISGVVFHDVINVVLALDIARRTKK